MDNNTVVQESTKFCKHCGSKILSAAVVCTQCGCQVEEIKYNEQPSIVINNANNNTNTNTNVNASMLGIRVKNKWVSFLLCVFLGYFGAHKFYEGTRAMFFEESRTYLHGEIVGVGLLLQNHFNGETEHNEFLLSLMKQYDMPSNLEEIGLAPTLAVQAQYYKKLKAGSAIDETNAEELNRLQAGLDYL